MAKWTAGTDYKNAKRRPDNDPAPGKPIPSFNSEGGFNSRQAAKYVAGVGARPTPTGAVKGDTGVAPSSGNPPRPGAGVGAGGATSFGFNSRATPEGNA